MTKNRGFKQKIEGMNGKVYDIEVGNVLGSSDSVIPLFKQIG